VEVNPRRAVWRVQLEHRLDVAMHLCEHAFA
jgi:hypothetical protein